jgi:hypothetical protein
MSLKFDMIWGVFGGFHLSMWQVLKILYWKADVTSAREDLIPRSRSRLLISPTWKLFDNISKSSIGGAHQSGQGLDLKHDSDKKAMRTHLDR